MPTLNAPQQSAVAHTHGPLLVLAGAGSGKTRVITEKIAWLLRHAGYSPDRITAVTFTNKAAREMASRVRGVVDASDAAKLQISTFHRLGLRILIAESSHIGLRPNLSIFDAEDTAKLIRDLGVAEPDRIKLVKKLISDCKQALITPAQAAEAASNDGDATVARIYSAYEEHLRGYNAVDFDDLLTLPTQLLESNSDAREHWQQQVHYMLVDEYQDTNPVQYRLMRALVGQRARFTVVGDDDQSIYRFRGARPENLADLSTDFPDLDVIKLEQNYRSAQRILRVANAVIGGNQRLYEKTLWSALGEGEPIRYVTAPDEQAEAERIVTDIAARRISANAKLRDFAVLYRSNYQARALEQALRSAGMPYRMTGGRSFFDHAEIKDLLAYLRLLSNPDDDRAFLRIINTPRRELGSATLQKLGTLAAERDCSLFDAACAAADFGNLPSRQARELSAFCDWMQATGEAAQGLDVHTLMLRIIDELDFHDWLRASTPDKQRAERRIKNVQDLADWMKRLAEDEKTLDKAVHYFGLLDMLDKADGSDDEDLVQLATLHASKGLEFPHVTIAGCFAGSIPHENAEDIEEERRLFYVGITRAQQSLLLTAPQRVRRGGETTVTKPSRFLDEIPPEDLERTGTRRSPDERRANSRARMRDLRALLEE